jgi:hypothetical protein
LGRRRRRKRRRPEEGKSRREARPERFVDVRVQRRPSGRKKAAKVTRVRRRDGEVTEERYEL